MSIEKLAIIGETINYGIPRTKILFDEAVASGNFEPIRNLARKQADEGASYIDVNIGSLSSGILAKTITEIQKSVGVPLCIDDPDPDKLEAALKVYSYKDGIPILNSATEARADKVFSLKKEFDCKIILLVSERMEGSNLYHNTTVEDTFRTAERLYEKALGCGFQPEQIYVDLGMVSIAADIQGLTNVILDTLEKLNSTTTMHTLIGLSNFTFGLPSKIVTPLQNAFLTLAMERGLDTIIGNTARKYMLLDKNDNYILTLHKVLRAQGYDRQMLLMELY